MEAGVAPSISQVPADLLWWTRRWAGRAVEGPALQHDASCSTRVLCQPLPLSGVRPGSAGRRSSEEHHYGGVRLVALALCGGGRAVFSRKLRPYRRRRRLQPSLRTAMLVHAVPEFAEPLPLEEWFSKARLHADLEQDIQSIFGDVPQQAKDVVDDTVGRIQQAARKCVAPGTCAYPFGSTVNGFGVASSDLDVILAVEEEELRYYMSFLHWHHREKRYLENQKNQKGQQHQRDLKPPTVVKISEREAVTYAVQHLAEFVPEYGFSVTRSLAFARFPLLTLRDEAGQLGDCDVSINNRLPLANSELLRSYSVLDPRARPLVLLVKSWAKSHKVCGAHEGNLSSYAWTIMAIYFMQLLRLLPSLQLLAKEETSISSIDYWGLQRTFDASFLPAEEYLRHPKAEGSEIDPAKPSLAEIVYGFFHFFGCEYRWGDEVVSIRCPDRRSADPWFRLYGRPHPEPEIHVEDPIELRDLNIVMQRSRLEQLKAELENAASMLQQGASLEDILVSAPLAEPTEPPVRTRRSEIRLPQRNYRPSVQRVVAKETRQQR